MYEIKERLEELTELVQKQEGGKKEKGESKFLWFFAVIGTVALVVLAAMAIYKFFAPDYLEDYDEDDYEDDFDDFFEDDEEDEDYEESSDGEEFSEDEEFVKLDDELEEETKPEDGE